MPSLLEFEERITPVVRFIPDFYTAERGAVLYVPPEKGVLSNDYSTVDFGAVLTVTQQGDLFVTGADRALPPDTLKLNPDGSFTLTVPGNEFPERITRIQFNYLASNENDPNEPGEIPVAPLRCVTIDITEPHQEYLVTGADAGGAPLVKVYNNGTGDIVRSFLAYDATFTGGVRVATGDVDLDGIDDIITAPGVGGSANIKVFSGVDGAMIYSGILFDPNFRGGATVAVGDVDSDGEAEVVVGAGDGGGPIVGVIDFSVVRNLNFIGPTRIIFINGSAVSQRILSTPTITTFFAYDPNMRSGIRVATADIDGPDLGFAPPPAPQGYTDPLSRTANDYIITAPGTGGAPHIKVFDFVEVRRRTALGRPFDPTLSFYAGDANNTHGVFVAGGDLDGDGFAEIITSGAGPDLGIVRTFNNKGGLLNTINIPVDEIPASGPNTGTGLYTNTKQASGNLLAPGQAPNSLVSTTPGMGIILPGVIRSGARIGTIDWNGDGVDEIIVASGPGNTPRVRVLDVSEKNGTAPVELANFLAYESTFLGGVNVNT
ncbi:MAG: hypothetical protein LC104_01850 [Bacteroidales bacterium]|nr:hypothetical protein [Bacteroidales bacterium]